VRFDILPPRPGGLGAPPTARLDYPCGMLLAALTLACSIQFPHAPSQTGTGKESKEPFAGFALERRPLPASAHVLRRAARPGMYFDAVGERSFLCGREDGGFEAWVWPWQVFYDARFAFQPDKALEPFELTRYASSIEVAPHATTLTYSSADAKVDVLIFCPDDQPVAFLWLAVDVDVAGTLSFSFHPRLQPQWPAATGGVAGSFDAPLGAFVLSEPSARVAAVVGSPWATRATAGEQYLLPDGALRLELAVDPARARREWIPIAIAAADATGGEDSPARAKQAYVAALRGAQALFDHHAQRWAERAALIPVPAVESALDEAFFWNAVSLQQGLVRSEALGDGLVAGYGPGGASSQRPGFAWFFTGDVGFNTPAYLGAGLEDTLKVGLRFAQRHQREDGKIPHEVVLSAHLCDWFAKYPFAFIHGDTTGLWIHACRQYLDYTGDRAFLAEAWPAIVAGYRWILAQDADGDGLPDNSRAGMGASEIGALRVGLATDVHLASACAVALRDVGELALVVGDQDLARTAQSGAQRAIQRIATGFWDEHRGRLAHALLQDGTLSSELTPWPAEAVAWRLVDGPHARATMDAIGADDLTSPWGVRFLSTRSPLFEPKGYNSGAVWPFLTGLTALGDFEVGRAQGGFDKLAAVARLTTSEALGRTPEILSGTRERSLDAAVPHQLFSSMAVVAPLVQGLFGYEPDALHDRVVVRPCLPEAWGERTVAIRGLHGCGRRFDLVLTRRAGVYELECVTNGEPPKLELAPRNGRAGSVRVRSR
jgi:hypothetical protein